MQKSVTPDPHSDARERKRKKARYGMRVSGRSVRLLARLTTDPSRKKKKRKKKKKKRR
jgi:hypothetical protein